MPTMRRLKISTSKHDSAYSKYVKIVDVDTEEIIDNVIEIFLKINIYSGLNVAKVTYLKIDDKEKESRHETIVENVEIDDITAFEIMDNIRKEQNTWQ